MTPEDTIFVAGHRGMVGSALVRRLQRDGSAQILTAGRDQLDLIDQHAVHVNQQATADNLCHVHDLMPGLREKV